MNTDPESRSRHEKVLRLTSRPLSPLKESLKDPPVAYALAILVAVILWGLTDPRAWFFANIGLLILFVVVRKRSAFQVSWLLETFPILSTLCFVLTTFYKRAEIFSMYEQHNEELISTLWLATFASYGFAFTCLWMIQRQAPPGGVIITTAPKRPIPRSILINMYVFGLIMNMFVRFFVPGEIRVIVISLGHMEIAALLIFIFQCLAGSPGFREDQIKWPLIGVGFWFLREVATTLFGGPIATLLGVAPLFARYVKPWFVVLCIAGALVFVPLIQGVKKEVRASREEAEVSNVEPQTIPRVFAKNVDKIIIQGDWNAYRKGFDEFVDRIYMTGMVFQIKSNVDLTQNFAHGETLVNSIFWNFIPRIIYPSKPSTGGSSELAQKYGGLLVEPGTSVGIGPISEFYINFGYTGAIVCMILMGAFYGFIMGKLFKHPLQPLGYVYAAMVYVSVIRPETNLADSFGGAIRAVFIWIILQWYVSRRMRGQEALAAKIAAMRPPDDPGNPQADQLPPGPGTPPPA